MPKPPKITKAEVINQIATQLQEPISLEEFVDRVLFIWPSNAKNPRAAVRQEIRDHHQGKTVIFTDKDTLTPIKTALADVRFRVSLSREELQKELFFIFPAFMFFVPQDFPPENIQFVDVNDQAIPGDATAVTFTAKSILGEYSYKVPALSLGWWFKKLNLSRKDSLLVTILDVTTAKFRLQPERHHENRHHQKDIATVNQQMADRLFAMLEEAQDDHLWASAAIPTVYAYLKNESVYPADHWTELLVKDQRMRWDDPWITYSEWQSPFERIFLGKPRQRPSPLPKVSKEQKQQIYRFHVSPTHQKNLWRRLKLKVAKNWLT